MLKSNMSHARLVSNSLEDEDLPEHCCFKRNSVVEMHSHTILLSFTGWVPLMEVSDAYQTTDIQQAAEHQHGPSSCLLHLY